ncbi:hypothetical protein BJY24_005941 [Nocardia transvalensis]|uniref:DUF8020 domain-containing protein n=1 Tax=Nocardia transvalensis TaxID=37333 RepID=A0A7W9UKY9_9NOCA|nr:hypothetical protein [Nocardia transvalensis]MBB5917029.1 hypothetical protein [Nocardia transvalensis]
MRIARFAATAAVSVAALGIAAATAHGEAGITGPSLSGADQGVAYTTTMADDHSAVTTTLAAGRFEVTPDAVAVFAPDGAQVGTVPLVYQAAGRTVHVTPEIDAAATTLTVRPDNAADISAPTPQTQALKQIGSEGQIIGGAALGCVIGIVVGIWFFGVGAILGCVVGGLIGGAIGANQP